MKGENLHWLELERKLERGVILCWHGMRFCLQPAERFRTFPSFCIIGFCGASRQLLTIESSLSFSLPGRLVCRHLLPQRLASQFKVASPLSTIRLAPPNLRYLSPSFPLLCKSSEHRETDQIWTVADPVTVLGDQRMLTFMVSTIVRLQILNMYYWESNLSSVRVQTDQTQSCSEWREQRLQTRSRRHTGRYASLIPQVPTGVNRTC